MDRRQQKTRQSIIFAFRTLLEKKELSNITVQEIIDEANIGRSTFYAHFETKDDLLKELCKELFQHIVLTAMSEMNTPCFPSNDEIPASVCCHLLHHLIEDNKDTLMLLTGKNSDLFLGYFKESLSQLIDQYFLSHFNTNKLQVPKSYLINHLSCSFVETIQWWAKEKYRYTPEEVTAYLSAVIIPIL